MIKFSGQGILLDIEGTTSSISFVHDVLFPYARRNLAVALRNLWGDPVMGRVRQGLAEHLGSKNFEEWSGGPGMPPESRLKQMHQALIKLMDEDAKFGPLKEIQGLIWREGYKDGTLRSHIYPELPRVLKEWKQLGKDVRIYSSGSIAAQKQFFKHVDNGTNDGADLTPYFKGYYDTTTGPKKEAQSYIKIVEQFGLPASAILFLSDVPAELDAARTSGMKTGLMCRPGNPPVPEKTEHPQLTTFDDVVFSEK
ncbi:MAG TPA: acireductone synthase [Gemmatales bacterium]|nr:acireductone synthase [Gemmatales bacterium]